MKNIYKKIRNIKRRCVICGKFLEIKVGKKGHYNKGHYFGRMKLPVGKGTYKKIGETKIGNKKFGVVKWTGREKKIEYWECDKCFKEP